jgi:hypothetical protein
MDARTSEPDKRAFLGNQEAVLTAGNSIYTIAVSDSGFNCGQWTATTGGNHPAGGGLNVLFGGGTPGTSNTVLRSYTSGTDYVTGGAGGCSPICNADTPTVTPILNGVTTVGYRFVWSFTDGPGPAIEFEQEVVVDGPVDGSETVNNSVVRETHTVRNLGPAAFAFGLRKQWDWQIGSDDGPHFGSCSTPAQACDASMNLTADGSLSGMYPAGYVMNEDPAVTACPPGVTPVGPNCGGAPVYLVAGTVTPPAAFTPLPDAPELLQYNSWGSLIGTCWQPALVNNATCGGGDTAVAYFYGLTPGTAINLAAGQARSFTQYVAAAENGCPAGIGQTIPTLNAWGIGLLLLLLLGTALLILRRRRGVA